MNIHFSNVNFSSRSGPNTFASRLAHELAILGHEIVAHTDEYDIFLVFIEPASLPRPGSKVIQRLDGIWFKPDQFYTHNHNIKWAYDHSSHVIWQSEFDKQMTEFHWGKKTGTVIHNGVHINQDVNIGFQFSKIREKYSRIFVSSSNWHRQKRLKENTEFFLKNRKLDDDCLIVLGQNPDYVINDNDIYYLGDVSHDICMQVYKIADWMIHLAWLDHCPNVVVEALSQNCAVICTDSGGTREIVKNNGIIIKENKKYNFELTDYDYPYDLDLGVMDLPEINVDNAYLNIKKIAQKYLRILEN